MNNKSIATALTLGFLAFIFLAIQPTPAQAEDCPPGTKLNPMGKCTWGGGWAAPTGPNSECPPGTKPAKKHLRGVAVRSPTSQADRES
jgi:hypothetical protein